MRTIFILICFVISLEAFAKSNTSGKIKEAYSSQYGSFALKLNTPLSDEVIQECPQNNGFAGTSADSDPLLKSTLLAAFASQKTVKLVIDGCTGNWLKIDAVFVYEN